MTNYEVTQLVQTLENKANVNKDILRQIERDAAERIDALTDVKEDADRIACNIETAVSALGELAAELDAGEQVRTEAEDLGLDI